MRGHSGFLKMIFREKNQYFFHRKTRKIFWIFSFRKNLPKNKFFGKCRNFSENFSGNKFKKERIFMRPLKIKDRCTKKKTKKCKEVIRTYDQIQTAYKAAASFLSLPLLLSVFLVITWILLMQN